MKKLFAKLFGVIAVLLSSITILGSLGCYASSYQTVRFSKFNTTVTITVKNFKINNSKTLNLIKDELSSLDCALSSSKFGSYIHSFNDLNVGESITLNDTAYFVISSAMDFNSKVSNKFCPLIYPLADLWQFTPNKYGGFFSLPSQDEIDLAKALCSPDLISLDTENLTISKHADGVKLDLGGVVKGYATDLISEILIDKGVTGGFVSLGGSSIFVIAVPDYLAISHPREKNTEIIRIKPLAVNGKSVSTSGDYERFYTYQGKRYSHLIDPTTGYPVDTGFQSVTVLGDNGMTADMLSTALMSYTYQEMLDFISGDRLGFDIIAIYEKDGVKQILTNKKQGEDFTLLDTEYMVLEI